jgi:chemotaxis protein CheZ
MNSKLTAEQLEHEIEKIAAYIAEAKVEIASISLPEEKTGNEKNIAHAALQLTEVVRHTEEATNAIMDKADAIMLMAGNLTDADASAKLGEYAVEILEACSFQDITGQRIKKVLNTLEQIELRIGRLVKLFGGKLPERLNIEDIDNGHRRADEDLLNGPQLSKDKPSQDDVDKLFSS